MPDFEIVDVRPDLKPLFRALSECGKRYHHIRNHRVLAQTIARLSEPPASLQTPPPDASELANSLLKAVVPFNQDLQHLRCDATADSWIQIQDGTLFCPLNANVQGGGGRGSLKPGLPQLGKADRIKLTWHLYCIALGSSAEGCGQMRFKLSRPPLGGPPGGPMWRALMAALPVAQSFLVSAETPVREAASN